METRRLFWCKAINCLLIGCAMLMGISYLLGWKFLIAQMLCFIGIFLILLLCAYFKSNLSGADLRYNTFIATAISLLVGQENPHAKGSAIALGCTLSVYFCFAVFRCFHTKRRTDVAECILNGRLVVGLCLCLTTGITIGDSLGVLLYEKIPEYQYQIQCEEEVSKLKDVKLEDHLDTLYCVINPAEWTVLSDEEKKKCYQLVGDIERTFLNLPHELRVVTLRLDEYTRGQYNPQTHTIEINELLLCQATGIEGLQTVCHEARHAYQHDLVEVLEYVPEHLQELDLFDKATIYEMNFENYVTEGGEYFALDCEVDAREFAEDAVNEYLYRLLKYGEENQRCIINDKEA